MDGFKNLEIKNFRGIEHLIIDDFSRVNVFLGQNNSGKSSVLEAILLLAGMSNPDLPLSLNKARTRNFRIAYLQETRYQFYNLDLTNTPEFSSLQIDGISRHLQMRLFHTETPDEGVQSIDEPLILSETVRLPNTLEMLYDITTSNGIKRFRSSLFINQSDVVSRQEPSKEYVEKNSAVLFSSDLLSSNLTKDLSELFKRKQKNTLLEYLQKFDTKINAIEILNNDVYVGFDDVKEMLPISMSGDGLRRFLNIVAGSANPNNTMILIDEIDNGLHYSAYKKLWEVIFALAVSTNKQVFVTTHSKETLYRLNEMLEEHSEYQDALRLYTIENTKLKGLQAYKYTFEGLNGACENDVELRSVVL
ncbi:MAG: AAA family ATPase [Bacteroidales bacterium]|nr:AAA family ATPase [Bacteroidales bacterium]